MSDEEKKATLELNHFSNITAYWKKQEYTNSEINNYIKIVLNLVEKQQKEIEELKNKYSDEKIRDTVIKRYREVIEKDYISKDKIKAKIEEYREILYSFEKELELKANKDKFIHKESMSCLLGQISILQSLL